MSSYAHQRTKQVLRIPPFPNVAHTRGIARL
jgi:hypothetical protein